MGVVRLLVTSGLAGAAGSVRAGVEVAELGFRRVPSLFALGARATLSSGAGALTAEAVFRDELLTLLDDAGEVAWRHARRARLEVSELTGPAGARRRHHRVKA